MQANLIALKLFLDELGQSEKIDSLDDRLGLQKVVYLGQIFGADLGYRYNWYIKGPYSPSLASDYYALDSAIQSGEKDFESRKLNDRIRTTLAKAKLLLARPETVPLSQVQWWELLCSADYLARVSRLPSQQVEEQLKKTKPHLVAFLPQAREHLNKYGPPLR